MADLVTTDDGLSTYEVLKGVKNTEDYIAGAGSAFDAKDYLDAFKNGSMTAAEVMAKLEEEGGSGLTEDQTATLTKLGGIEADSEQIDSLVLEVQPKKGLIKYLTQSKNLFNLDTVTLNQFMSSSGSITTQTNYGTSDYIPVVSNENYIANYDLRFITYFNEDKNVIGGVNDSTPSGTSIIPPSGCSFLIITFTKENAPSLQFEKGTEITLYEKYGLPYLDLGRTIKPLETDMFEQSRNLFNKYTAVDGFYISWTDGLQTTHTTYSASGYIEIEPDETYTISESGSVYHAWYDENKVFISGNQVLQPPYTAPSNAKYIKITTTISKKETAQFEKGDTPTSYKEPFQLKDIYKENSKANKWEGFKWATLGDSITAQLNWQPNIYTYFDLILINDGVGGATIANNGTSSFSEGTRISAMPIDAELISVLGGTNDWAQSVALGTEDSTDDTTFYGALNSTIEQLITKYPTKRIFFMTTPYGEMPSRVTDGLWSSSTENNQGLTTKDYSNAIINRCKAYNIPYVNIQDDSGINSFNVTHFMSDDGNHIHPNTEGAERYSQLIIDFINKL